MLFPPVLQEIYFVSNVMVIFSQLSNKKLKSKYMTDEKQKSNEGICSTHSLWDNEILKFSLRQTTSSIKSDLNKRY